MKKLIALVLLALPITGIAQELSLDTENASVSFLFKSDDVKGTVAGVEATISLNLSDLSSSVIQGTADVSTLSTKTKARDKHLKSKSFFNADKYPKMSFTSSSVTKKGDEYFAKGALTIKDVTKNVTFKMAMVDEVLIMSSSINADDYGVSPKKAEKSEVDVTIRVPFSK